MIIEFDDFNLIMNFQLQMRKLAVDGDTTQNDSGLKKKNEVFNSAEVIVQKKNLIIFTKINNFYYFYSIIFNCCGAT